MKQRGRIIRKKTKKQNNLIFSIEYKIYRFSFGIKNIVLLSSKKSINLLTFCKTGDMRIHKINKNKKIPAFFCPKQRCFHTYIIYDKFNKHKDTIITRARCDKATFNPDLQTRGLIVPVTGQ